MDSRADEGTAKSDEAVRMVVSDERLRVVMKGKFPFGWGFQAWETPRFFTPQRGPENCALLDSN